MDKKFMKVPEDRFERIMFSVNLAENLSGNKVTHQEIMETINKENIALTEEQQSQINEKFSIN